MKKLTSSMRKAMGEGIVSGSMTSWFRDQFLRYRTSVVAITTVGIVGLAVVVPVAIYQSMAATSTASLEAENGTRSANAGIGTDNMASGGQFISFNSPVATNYDFTVTSVTASPSAPTVGQSVTFSAVVKNIGTGASPAGTTVGVSYWVDGAQTTWSDTFMSSIAAGQSVTLTANNGPSGSSTWAATSGTHTVEAFVDDINRFPAESDENNNRLTISLNVGGGTATGTIGSVYGASAVFYLGSLPSNIRNGVYNDAKYAGVQWIRADLQSPTGDGVFVTETIANGLKAMPTIFRQGATNSITLADWAYSKGVRVVMLDNEANTTGRSAQNYSDYFKQAYNGIHAQHPDMLVLTTGLAQSGTGGQTQWEWLDNMGQNGIFNLDNVGVGMHWYFNEYTPGATILDNGNTDWHWRGYSAEGLKNYLAIIDKYTVKKPKIWITESGYSRSLDNLQDGKQATRVAAAYHFNDAWLKPYRDRLGPVFWFSLIDKAQDGAYEQNFGGWSYDSSFKHQVADAVKQILAQPLQP